MARPPGTQVGLPKGTSRVEQRLRREDVWDLLRLSRGGGHAGVAGRERPVVEVGCLVDCDGLSAFLVSMCVKFSIIMRCKESVQTL